MASLSGSLRITRDDVIKAIGAVDDVTIAQMIATGATVDELAEAQAWMANDEPMMNSGRPLATGRVRELVDILAELEPDDDEDGRGAPAAITQGKMPRHARRAPEHILLGQFSLRFGTGASNRAISAVCGARPLKVSTLPSLEITTRSPSAISPARIISAIGSCRLRWITRFRGLAP